MNFGLIVVLLFEHGFVIEKLIGIGCFGFFLSSYEKARLNKKPDITYFDIMEELASTKYLKI